MSKRNLLIFLILILTHHVHAQFNIYGLNRSKSISTHRISATQTDTLDLPFLDDFASSVNRVNTDKWIDSENVFIDPNIGINPPNIHVASIDGLKANGDPYNPEGGLGEADVLTSRFIRLNGLAAQDSVYLSFYWELSGLGEAPESTDRLVLQFKSAEGTWDDIFTIDANTPTPNQFYQHTFIKLLPEYLYDGFQFRFTSFCDLNGRFDIWNLDYIYLDKARSVLNKSIRDSGLANYPGPIFNNYHSVPLLHLQQTPDKFLNTNGNQIRFQSLKDGQSNLNYRFSSILKDADSAVTIAEIHQNQVFSTSNYTGNITLLPIEPDWVVDYATNAIKDSLVLNWQTFSTDNDQDYFNNDTVNAHYTLQNYYALDDGTAEFAGGAKSNGAKVAMKYGIAAQGHRLTHIDICFVNFEGASTPVSLDLIVWTKGPSGLPDQELSRTSVILSKQDSLNAFTSYKLNEFDKINIDTVFIGYEHREDANIFIGIDRNTHFGRFLYSKKSNDSGDLWMKNTNNGTPMIRPRFDERLITSIDNGLNNQIWVYPNPTTGEIFLREDCQNAQLFNLLGSQVFVPVIRSNKNVVMDLTHLSEGVYILNYIFEGRNYTQKIIKN